MERNLLVSGFGGQGIMLLGKLLADCACENTDMEVTFFPSYGAQQRGGTANCYVVISDSMIGTPAADMVEDLIVMNKPSLKRFLGKLKSGGNLMVNSSIVTGKVEREDIHIIQVPATEMALEMGNAKVLNLIMLGVYVGYTEILPPELVLKTIEKKLRKRADLISMNQAAFHRGLEIGKSEKIRE